MASSWFFVSYQEHYKRTTAKYMQTGYNMTLS